jgi:hypothetical protein
MDLLRWFSEYGRDHRWEERRKITRIFRSGDALVSVDVKDEEAVRAALRQHGLDVDHVERCEGCRLSEDRVGDLYMIVLALNALATDDERDWNEIGTAYRVLIRLLSGESAWGPTAPDQRPEPRRSVLAAPKRPALKVRILEMIDQGMPNRSIAALNGVTIRYVQMIRAERDGRPRNRRRAPWGSWNRRPCGPSTEGDTESTRSRGHSAKGREGCAVSRLSPTVRHASRSRQKAENNSQRRKTPGR